MNTRTALLSGLLFLAIPVLSLPVMAVEQEETFTDLKPGQDMLDPAKLAGLLREGDVRAMNNIALLWAKGFGGKQSYEEAMRWWKEAAKRGYTVAMNNIGLMHANGHGVAQSYEEAFNWWHQSAFLGNAWAMNNVGDLYENGLGVQQDLTLAMTWYQSAAEQGERMAMYNIGTFYDQGKGVAQDYGQALAWYRKAAEKGDASSMHSIGVLHAEGKGVAADPVEAWAWFSVADKRYPPEDAGEAETNKADLDALSRRLDQAQLARARERAAAIDVLTTPPEPEPPRAPTADEKAT